MTQVDTLTAQLGITGLAQFLSGLKAADAQIDQTRQALRGLTVDALAARAALGDLKIDTAGLAASTAALKEFKAAMADTGVTADATKTQIRNVKMDVGQSASTVAETEVQKRALKSLEDQAIRTAAAERLVGTSGGNNYAVLDRVEQQNASELRRISNQRLRSQFYTEESRLRSGEAMAPNLADALANNRMADAAGARNASQLLRLRMQQGNYTSFITDEGRAAQEVERLRGAIPLGSAPGTTSFTDAERAYRDLRRAQVDAERVAGAIPLGASGAGVGAFRRIGSEGFGSFEGSVRGAGRFGLSGGDIENQMRRDLSTGGLLGGLFGAQEAKRIGEITRSGGGGSDGINRGALGGLLPGGARPSQAILTSLLGIAAAGGPAVLPSALAAAPVLGAGAGALLGAAGTLKLAFDGITSAAFQSKQAFDKLTPVQQQFVQTLRSLDAGLGQTLKGIAQGTLLPQLSSALHSAFTPSAVSSLSGGVGAFSNAIGGGAQQFGKLFGSSSFQNQFGTMLQQDAGYLRTFLGALTPLTDAFVRFQVAAFPLLHWLGELTTQFSDWVDQSIRADAANGRLAEFFDILKTSLQTTGELFLSVAHLSGAFVDALGFQNSTNLVKLLTRAINDLAGLLKSNSKTFSDFFAGAVAAAGDLVTLINDILKGLKPILSGLNALIGGAKGWKIAIETVAIAWLIFQTQFIRGTIEMGIAIIDAFPELAILTAIVLIATHWRQFTTSMVLLFRAAYAAVKGILDEMTFAFLYQFKLILDGFAKAFDWVPIIGGELDKVNKAFGDWVSAFNTNGQKQFASAGSLAGQAWGAAFTSAAASSAPAGLAGPVGTPTQFGGTTGPVGTPSFGLPASITYALKAAAAGHGSIDAANAQAYGFYQKILAQGGLTRAQKLQVFGLESQYAPSAAFGTPPPLPNTTTSGAAAGFQLPNSYQLAIARAGTTPGSGDDVKAIRSAINYIKSVVSSLSPTNQTAALTEEGSLQSQLSGFSKTATTNRLGTLRAALSSRAASLSGARTTLAGSTGGSPGSELSAVNVALRFAGAQMEQLDALQKQLASEKQTTALKVEEARVQREITATASLINQAQKDQVAALKERNKAILAAQQTAEQNQIARVLGIGGADPSGRQAAASSSSHLRTFLNETLKSFGLAGTGSGALGPFVTELKKAGDINQRQYVSLEKILTAIGDMKKDTGKISSAATGNISQRLAEIKQELVKPTNFSDLNSVTTEQSILRHSGAHLVGNRAQRARFMEHANEALQNRGMLSHAGGAALGIPLTRNGSPALHHTLEVKVKVDGDTPISKQAAKNIAGEVYAIFQGNRKRNTTLMTGPNAGRNLGNGLG